MLNYAHLRYFRAVAHAGNLTRAAQQLHVSQSAVSVQIQRLEADLGAPLFHRRGRQLVLTDAGRIALDHADTIFAVGDELTATLRADRPARRVLAVGALATLSRNLQLTFLRPLLGRDDVEIVVRSGGFADLLHLLEVHRLDVLLANASPPRTAGVAYVPHRIAEQPVSLIGHPRRVRRRRSWQRLLRDEPVVLPALETSIRTGFDALAYRLDLRVRIAAEVDDMAMLRLFAREDVGLAVIPPIVVRDELASGMLVEVAPLPELTETFYAITMARRHVNPLLPVLLDAASTGDPSARAAPSKRTRH
jgi:LysR family transcriptional activator of nhaA